MHSQDRAEAVLAHVAANLRALRKAAGLSQDEVAKRAGLSRRMLVALEGGDTNISLARLNGVAIALGVSFARLVEPTGAVGARTTVWRGRDPASHARFLGAMAVEREAEFWAWELAPGERYGAEPDPPGYSEALHVSEGVLTLEIGGGREEIGAGGFIRFPSDQAYAYVNLGEGPLRFLRVVLV